MDSLITLLKYLKKKGYILDVEKAKEEVSSATITLKKNTDLYIRDAIAGLGTILLEDLEKHYYITSIKTGFLGNVLAYAIIQRNEQDAEIIVYAHEGLIKQGLTEKALSKLKNVLC